MNSDVTVNGRPWRVAIEATEVPGRVEVSIKGRRRTYDASWIDADTLSLIPLDGHPRVREFGFVSTSAGELRIAAGGRTFHATVLSDGKSNQRHPHRAERSAETVEGRQTVVATMPGRVVRVLVAPGDRVTAKQAVVVVEAMKRENEMRAPKDGLVREVSVKEGAAIEAGALLVVID
jgi:biotin carboxyl carrier protein